MSTIFAILRALALGLCLSLACLNPALADPIAVAFDRAIAQFEAAYPHLPQDVFGVDVEGFRDALTLRRFASRHWGGSKHVAVQQGLGGADCGRFAAYVVLPPDGETIPLVICPRFGTEGTDALRGLTILHEMVHVVAGPDECRAMAFAARVEKLATGQFTPVDAYWQANGCAGTGFRLP